MGGPRGAIGVSGRRALFVLALVLTLLPSDAARAATTYLQGRSLSDQNDTSGLALAGSTLTLDVTPVLTSTTVGGGFFVADGLLPGTRDRVQLSGIAFQSFIGRTFFAGAAPVLAQNHLLVEGASLTRWADLLEDGTVDGDGTLDDTLGVVFGEVRDGLGNPVAGATVSLSPSSGEVFYFNGAGDPDPLVTQTGASGRFLVLDVTPGSVVVHASVGAAPAGTVYGRVPANVVAGLSPVPTLTASGSAADETGAAVPGAIIDWDFDGTVSTLADGAGAYVLPGLARDLDLTLRGTAAGYRPALTFSRALDEFADADRDGTSVDLDVRFLSESAYLAIPAAYGIVQAPSLGMIVGRVLAADGSPLAGAGVSLDPVAGTIRYFDAGGAPAPGLLQTSASGLFAVLNVPIGSLVLDAVAPDQTIRRAVARSEAGAVTRGDLRGLPIITVHGKIADEQFRSNTIAGAVVSVVEYPSIATIAGPAGDFTLPGVPAGELVTFMVGHIGFKPSLSFTERTPLSDLNCTNVDCSCTNPVTVASPTFDEAQVGGSTPFGVSGRVVDIEGIGIADAVVTFTRVAGTGSLPLAVQTDGGGAWTQSGFETGSTYRAIPSKRSLRFVPDHLDFSGPGTGLDFASCSEGKLLFAISEASYSTLYLNAGAAPNRSRGLLAAGVLLSNGVGALGLSAQLTPASGTLQYGNDGKFGSTFINLLGTAQVLNANPSMSGLVVFDPRNDEATLGFARLAEDSVTLTSGFRLDCDTSSSGAFANLYPCDGARFTARAKDAFFQWDLGTNVRAQVQFATDPSFSTIALTSASGGAKKFLPRGYWHAGGRVWKKIKKLAPAGSPVYWRVLGRSRDGAEDTTDSYVFYLP